MLHKSQRLYYELYNGLQLSKPTEQLCEEKEQ